MLIYSSILDYFLEVCESYFRWLLEDGERCGNLGMKGEKRKVVESFKNLVSF